MIRAIVTWKNILSPALRVFDVFFFQGSIKPPDLKKKQKHIMFSFFHGVRTFYSCILIIFINIVSDWTILFLVLSNCCALK